MWNVKPFKNVSFFTHFVEKGECFNVIYRHCQVFFFDNRLYGFGVPIIFFLHCSVSAGLSKAVLGPVFDLCSSWCRPSVCAGLGLRRLRWCRRKAFPPVFASVGDAEAQLASVVQTHPGQEMCGHMLGFDPRTRAHFGLSSLVEGHVPLPAGPVVPVYDWGVSVVAVLLEALPKFTVFWEAFLKKKTFFNNFQQTFSYTVFSP